MSLMKVITDGSSQRASLMSAIIDGASQHASLIRSWPQQPTGQHAEVAAPSDEGHVA